MRFTARPITPAAVTSGLLGLFGLAACGDDDDGSTADTSAADTTQPADTTASTEAAAQAPR